MRLFELNFVFGLAVPRVARGTVSRNRCDDVGVAVNAANDVIARVGNKQVSFGVGSHFMRPVERGPMRGAFVTAVSDHARTSDSFHAFGTCIEAKDAVVIDSRDPDRFAQHLDSERVSQWDRLGGPTRLAVGIGD